MRLTVTMPWLVALVLLGLGLGGCNRQDSPQGAYRAFYDSVRKGERKDAWAVLSKATQDALTERAKAVGEASGSAEKPEPLDFFFANVPPPPDVTEVSLVREEGDTATVLVRSAGSNHEVRMVREPSGWKVDLTASLQP
ncbi:hypothetical protein JY651_02350 [Pyxidicoccus parkwayensis]|uniref:Lipoprotein n=1 Tax=Pyxidicoccus parkwayensis TaxID=2813578 RepID=A0ABX7NY47_9BACT|nr:hypothetical protein [Pyxidicoccus parkwaysis]QSQ23846.1 hypothetical protein JY651_02350 [Pyxidicoccus parkwaysis]